MDKIQKWNIFIMNLEMMVQKKMQTPVIKSQVIKLDSPRPYVFIVRLHDEKNRIIERSFCASSEEDRQNWCTAFEQVSGSVNSSHKL